ncbi:MAG: pentapeptide repeat-containing protein [Clostridiales bacterium]|nr:pentapeptide repeat-containing protein [Clostridiales bacterium]
MHKQSWFSTFEKHFQAVCTDIVKAQDESVISAISHLEYAMKYTNFLNRRYVAEVWVYGDGWYLNNGQRMIGEYDVSLLFVNFDELWDKLLAERKRYIGKVSAQEVTSLMIDALPKFYSYLASIVRFAIIDCVDKKPYIDILKNDVFKVRVGDYMSKTEPVFTQKKKKDAEELADWFSERLDYDYVFEDCAGLDFSARDFSYTVLRYIQFRRAILNNANLQFCSLIGTSFYRAQLENCRLDNSAIFEADFSYANMKNSSLVSVRGRAGMQNKKHWQFVGFLPVSFKYADLTGTDFTDAKLAGADFTNANLAGANLSDADLAGADFTDAILDGADFTDAVLDGAIFTGAPPKGVDTAILKQRAPDTAEAKSEPIVFSGNICTRAEFMHHYVMEMDGGAYLPKVPKGEDTVIVNVSGSGLLNKIDYDTRSEVISDRLKLLLEQYLPEYIFVPIVYYDAAKTEQTIFWRFKPPLCEDIQAVYRNDGVVSHISYPITNAPIVFSMRSPKGIRSIVCRMAVAESVLRRSILGLKFTKISDWAVSEPT